MGDVDANVREQLELANRVARAREWDEDTLEAAGRLADLVIELNLWFEVGGHLPIEWNRRARKDA